MVSGQPSRCPNDIQVPPGPLIVVDFKRLHHRILLCRIAVKLTGNVELRDVYLELNGPRVLLCCRRNPGQFDLVSFIAVSIAGQSI